MAILKALTKRQLNILEHGSVKLNVRAPRAPIMPKAEYVSPERLAEQRAIALYTGKITKCDPGKPLKMWHHWQADYRSFTPRGAMTQRDAAKHAARVNGNLARFGNE